MRKIAIITFAAISCLVGRASMADVVQINWVPKSDSPIQLDCHYGGVIGSIWYHAGGAGTTGVGQRTCQAYNLQTDTWLSMANMNSPHHNHGVVTYGGRLYAFGGISCWNCFYPQLEVYNPGSGSWSYLSQMPVRYRYFGSAISGDRIYATGGDKSPDFLPLNSLWIYDISDNAWSSGPSVPTAIKAHCSTAYGGKIYTFGGYDTSYNTLDLVQIYDIALGTWSTEPAMPVATRYSGAAVIDDMIYVVGGQNDSGNLKTVQVYEPATGTWHFGTDMPTAGLQAAVDTYSGKLYVYFSGSTYEGTPESPPPEPELIANWYGPDPSTVAMGEPYRINVSIFAEESWPGGTAVIRLEETGYYPDDKWNSGNDELLNDIGRWTCYVYPSPFDGDPPVLVDEDYEIGTEEVELYVPPGGGVMPVANLYFEGSHKWAWIPPFNLSFIGDWIQSVTLGRVVPGFGTWLTWEAYQQTVNSSVQLLQYSYTGYCNGVSEEYFGVATVDGIPIHKQFVLAESTGFAITASVPTALGLLVISTPAAPLAPPLFLKQLGLLLISEGLYIIAADPPNMDYTSITVPEILLIPEIQEIGDPEFRAATLLVFRLEAVIRALKDSMEKYEGAKLDGAIEWEVIQLAAANYYTKKAQDMTNNLASFWEEAVSDLPVPTPEQIQQARDWIAENGLPDIEVDVLLALGYTQEEIDELSEVIASMDDTYFERIDKLPDLLKIAGEGLQEIANKIPSVPESLVIEAVVEVSPPVLNLKSEGNWVTCYIELPEGYDVSDIDVNSLLLQNILSAESLPIEIGDFDNDGIPDLMVKFDRQELIQLFDPSDQIIALTGQLTDGTPLAGIDVIRVIHGL